MRGNFSARQAAALRRLAAGFRKSGIFDKIGSSEVIKILHEKILIFRNEYFFVYKKSRQLLR